MAVRTRHYLSDVQRVILGVLWDKCRRSGVRSSLLGGALEAHSIVSELSRRYPKRFGGAPAVAQNSAYGTEVNEIVNAVNDLESRGFIEVRTPVEFPDMREGIRPLGFWNLSLTLEGMDECSELFAPWLKKFWKWVERDVRTVFVAVIIAFITAVIAYYIFPVLGIGNR